MSQTSQASGEPAAATHRTAAHGPKERFLLRLNVTGTTFHSTQAIAHVRKICEEHLRGRYQLEVIDLYQHPQLAKDEQIVAVPTLIRKLPPPLRQIIGDMSKAERVLAGLDLRKVE